MSTEATKTDVGSYFISNYPPFSQWKQDSLSEVEGAMLKPPRDVPLGLYLHIPFCRKRCKFCYFKVYTDKNKREIDTYVQALCKELELVTQQEAMGDRNFRFVYFGGGTPSYLAPNDLDKLERRLREVISWDKAEEVTFECEPGTLNEKKVKKLKELGVTRLSLGVENFNDKLLSENGRAHLSQEVYRAWDWIVAANFPNVNIDLISGMVGETWDNWKFNVEKTLELSPESVTIYQMELPFNTVYSKGILNEAHESPVADWQTKRAWVQYAFDTLADAGYSQSSAYTMIKDPSKVSFSYRDNLWKGSDLLATGIASFGHISGVHYQNLAQWNKYLESIESGKLPLSRAYTPTTRQAMIRELILLLKRGYLELEYFRDKFGKDIWEEYSDVWNGYQEEGYLDRNEDRIELTSAGLLRVDGLLPSFFEPEHQGVRYT